MDVDMKRTLTVSPVFNIGFGFVRNKVSITGEYEIKIKIYLIPFLAFTYTRCIYLNY